MFLPCRVISHVPCLFLRKWPEVIVLWERVIKYWKFHLLTRVVWLRLNLLSAKMVSTTKHSPVTSPGISSQWEQTGKIFKNSCPNPRPTIFLETTLTHPPLHGVLDKWYQGITELAHSTHKPKTFSDSLVPVSSVRSSKASAFLPTPMSASSYWLRMSCAVIIKFSIFSFVSYHLQGIPSDVFRPDTHLCEYLLRS